MTPIEVYRALHKKMCTTAAADPNSDGSIPLSKEEFTKATDGAEKSKCCTKRACKNVLVVVVVVVVVADKQDSVHSPSA